MKNVSHLRINRKVCLRSLSVILLSSFFLLSFVDTSAQKPNFSGTWAFNATKSDMGQGGQQAQRPQQGQQGQRPQQGQQGQQAQQGQQGQRGGFGAGTLTIKQDGNTITVDRVRPGRDGQSTTTTEKFTLDGKESVNTTQRGSSKTIAKWSADGKTLTLETTRKFNEREMKSTDVWTLTDAKTLTIASTSPGRDGAVRKTKIVYDKK